MTFRGPGTENVKEQREIEQIKGAMSILSANLDKALTGVSVPNSTVVLNASYLEDVSSITDWVVLPYV